MYTMQYPFLLSYFVRKVRALSMCTYVHHTSCVAFNALRGRDPVKQEGAHGVALTTAHLQEIGLSSYGRKRRANNSNY